MAIGWSIYFLIFIIVLLFLSDIVIVKSTESYLFSDVDSVPVNKTGLLLGTVKTLKSGRQNLYFFNRIDATVELFNAGKIECIVVSGDNHIEGYNEPQDMKDELVKRGVPEERVYCDYAGFRTLDSVIRMWKIFGQTKFTIISQPFHIRRAVYIARQNNLDVVGYAAADVKSYGGFLTKVREKFARVKVFIDLIFNKSPRFLGEPVVLP
ncbi:MAG: protein SanA [Bacteroidetes bacterium HGW-Bacteroidetes-6]|jgi:SanA protein|nr:MAG: protein SanA [Bacteroidetes bacterium HGW-Bacteroidetes-6]